jgi:hypothetical protein
MFYEETKGEGVSSLAAIPPDLLAAPQHMGGGTMTTNVELTAEAITVCWNTRGDTVYPTPNVQARAALEAIDPRLADLTPDDVRAILDFAAQRPRPWLSAQAREVLSR